MISIKPFADLGTFKNAWLDAHYHFSFAGYHDPARMGMGPLRVWNDDTIQPHGGFDTHSHREMEIVTYVRHGAITHLDSLGNRGLTRAGDVQVMSAGTGIEHSEINEDDEATTLFQIWIMPDRRGHDPYWKTRQFPKEPVSGRLPVLASGLGDEGALPIHQEATVLGGCLAAGADVSLDLGPGRGAYLVPTTGTIEINGVQAEARAGVQVTYEHSIVIHAIEDAEVVLVEVSLEARSLGAAP